MKISRVERERASKLDPGRAGPGLQIELSQRGPKNLEDKFLKPIKQALEIPIRFCIIVVDFDESL